VTSHHGRYQTSFVDGAAMKRMAAWPLVLHIVNEILWAKMMNIMKIYLAGI